MNVLRPQTADDWLLRQELLESRRRADHDSAVSAPVLRCRQKRRESASCAAASCIETGEYKKFTFTKWIFLCDGNFCRDSVNSWTVKQGVERSLAGYENLRQENLRKSARARPSTLPVMEAFPWATTVTVLGCCILRLKPPHGHPLLCWHSTNARRSRVIKYLGLRPPVLMFTSIY